MEIKINCKAAETINIEKLKEFQGDIKELSEENKKKLIDSIIKHGVISPFFIWKNENQYNIIDGHQRLIAIKSMQSEGYIIPSLPVVFIEAKNKNDAKEKLLQISSQYGDFNLSELDLFVEEIDIDVESIRLLSREINLNIPDLSPISGDEQGKLDTIKDKECPNCGHKFKG